MTIHQSVTAKGVLELVMDNPKVNALPIADTQAIAELLDGVKHRPEITAVILTCLLYTSPSPRDGLLSRMPSSA